jgi:translation elongation factor EF-Tu-like GTPase
MRDIYILNTTRNGGQFVSEQYNSSQIYVRSTDVNRTIMSAAAQLQGVYPIKTGPNL